MTKFTTTAKFFSVTCKCGHVGKKFYIPISFPVIAEDGKMAAKIARDYARVKHAHKDAILNVEEITCEEYERLKEINQNDPYLHCKNKQEQWKMCNLEDRLKIDMHNDVLLNKKKRVERVEFLRKKNKQLKKVLYEIY